MPAPAFYPRLLPSLALKLSVFIALLLPQILIALSPSVGKASSSTQPHAIVSSTIDPATRSRICEAYGKTRLSFQANQGQSHSKVMFLARGSGYNLFLTPTEAAMTLRIANRTRRNADSQPANYTPPNSQSAYIKMKLVGANPAPKLSGLDPLPGACNYFIGSGADNWRTDVPEYARVKYTDVYRGIDMIFYGNQSDLEYDFKVAPGADPAAINISFESPGAPLSIDKNGDLIIETAAGQLRQRKPFAYQEVNGANHQITAQYVLKGNGIGFRTGSYDKSKPLIIDPVLSYSTYLGASGTETGWAIAVDSAGNAYIAGQTSSLNFPTTQDAFQKNSTGINDVFVIKLNPAGSAPVYSTYIGGAGDDFGFGVAVDEAGNAYVTGQTSSLNFPSSIPFTDFAGAFILKLNPAGNSLVYSIIIGGRGTDTGKAIAVDSAGAAYVTGETFARDFPVVNGFQSRFKEGLCGFEAISTCSEAFVAKVRPDGTGLVYATYLGGSGTDTGTAIAVDSAGAAYVTGQTASTDFPTTPDAFQREWGGSNTGGGFGGDVFVTKLAPSGLSLVYSTFLAGGDDDRGSGIAIDSEGNAYIGGTTDSFNFPTTPGAFQSSNGGSPVYKSTTGGSSFSAIKNGLVTNNVKTLAVDPANPSTIYASITTAASFNSFAGSVFKSTDGGNSWIASSNGLSSPVVNALVIDPDAPSTVYAGTSQGVFKSTDGGNSWAVRNQGLTFIGVNALAIDRKRTSTIYAGVGTIAAPPSPPGGVGGGIFKSTDAGATWAPTDFNKKPSHIIVLSLAIDPQKTQILYAGTNDGFYRGSKGGKKWKGPTLVDIQPSPQNAAVTGIAIDPFDRSTIHVAFGSINSFPPSNGGFFKSTDRGLTWRGPTTGVNVSIAKTIAVDPRNSSILYAGGYSLFTFTFNNPPSGALLKSTNGGESWSSTDLSDAPVNAVVIAPQNSTVYVGASLGSDAFITKLNPTGSTLVYSTHLGGRGADLGFGLAIDSAGVAYVTGHTVSDRFPAVKAFQASKGRQDAIGDAFVAALNRDGSAPIYSSYLGGNGIDEAFAIAVDEAGAAYVTGRNNSINFPTVNPLQAAFFGSLFDAFITKVAPAESP